MMIRDSVKLRQVAPIQKEKKEPDGDAPTSPLPKEFAMSRLSLRKIDIHLVETKGFVRDEEETKLPSVTLTKVDIDATREKNKQSRSTEAAQLPKDFSSRKLNKVDIHAVEHRGYVRSEEETKLPSVSLKKVAIVAVEKKSPPLPTELLQEMSMRSLALRHVESPNEAENGIPEENADNAKLPLEFSPTRLSKKMDIEGVEKREKEKEMSSSKSLPDEFSPKHLQKRVVEDHRDEKETSPANQLPEDFSPKRLIHVEVPSKKSPALYEGNRLPREISTRRSQIMKIPDMPPMEFEDETAEQPVV